MKKVYIVFGHANTGSCSLTFPEDFDFDNAYESEEDAQTRVKELNDKSGYTQLEEDDEALDFDGVVYDYYECPFFSKK